MDFFINKFNQCSKRTAIVTNSKEVSYEELLEKILIAKDYIHKNKIVSGEVISLIGDYTPNSIALMFALISNKNIIVPFNYSERNKCEDKLKIAFVKKNISVNVETDFYSIEEFEREDNVENIYYQQIRNSCNPGLVLFTSGTSGHPKGAVHNFSRLLEKFKTPRNSLKTLNFLLFDHWGGLNTMFHTLSNGGTIFAMHDRQPRTICEFIEKYKIELLPASPTFFNLLILSEEYKNNDLSSLKIITYGSEPMPILTLKKISQIFKDVKIQQTYGLIEIGVLRSKSKSDNSLWVKVGGDGFKTRVINNLLEIKADSAMLGYLNAPSPFTEDGWFMTGDLVEVDGEYLKILGRNSEIINVGGEKVYPQEVENVIQELEGIAEVTVYGEKNLIMGNIVCAKVRLLKEVNEKEFITHIKNHCKQKMQSFKVPVKILIENENQFSERFKKIRI